LSSKVVAALRGGIRNGTYPPGSSAPSEEELAAEHSVSRAVVREAFAELEESGEVINRPGRRRRFADSAPSEDSRYESIAAEIRSLIANGTYVTGQPLPSQSALGREYGASRVTIRASLALLEAEGAIKRNAKNVRCVA
jgi:DNA-binding GntR family transcriptional regulator